MYDEYGMYTWCGNGLWYLAGNLSWDLISPKTYEFITGIQEVKLAQLPLHGRLFFFQGADQPLNLDDYGNEDKMMITWRMGTMCMLSWHIKFNCCKDTIGNDIEDFHRCWWDEIEEWLCLHSKSPEQDDDDNNLNDEEWCLPSNSLEQGQRCQQQALQ